MHGLLSQSQAHDGLGEPLLGLAFLRCCSDQLVHSIELEGLTPCGSCVSCVTLGRPREGHHGRLCTPYRAASPCDADSGARLWSQCCDSDSFSERPSGKRLRNRSSPAQNEADDAEQCRSAPSLCSPARPCVCRLLPASGNPLLEAVLFRLWELVSRWPCWQRLLAPWPSWELPPPGRRCEWLCARRGPRRECGCEDQE